MTTKVQCSCRQTKILVDYVRATNPENLNCLWAPLQGELPENQEPEQFLRDARNRVSHEALREIMAQTKKATSDNMAVYKAALADSNGSHLGLALKRRFRIFFGPKQAVQKVQEGSPFLLGNKPDILSVSHTHAVVRLRWVKDLSLSSDFCLFAKGQYQAIPSWFGLAPARLWERECFFKGGSCCEYEIWWDRRPRKGLTSPRVLPKGRRPYSATDFDVKQPPSSVIAKGTGPKTRALLPTRDQSKDRKGPPDVSPDANAPPKKGLSPLQARSQGKRTVKRAKKAYGTSAGFPTEAKTSLGQGRQNRQGLADRLPRGTETILLVDDNAMFMDVCRQMLEAMGYRVVGAVSGQEAVKKYQKHSEKIHMVILNMVLPDMIGGEVYDKLSAVNPEVKVLLSSGYGIDRTANEVLARGCKGFLQKPFSLEKLSRRMREILDNKQPAAHG